MEINENFSLITYHDSGSHSRIVPSPTKVIHELGMQNYGLWRPGKQFYVHKEDIEAEPNKFVVVVQETPTYSNTIRMLIEEGKLDKDNVDFYEQRALNLVQDGILDKHDSDTLYKESYIIELLTNTQPESQPESQPDLQPESSVKPQEGSGEQVVKDMLNDMDKILNGDPESTNEFDGLSDLIDGPVDGDTENNLYQQALDSSEQFKNMPKEVRTAVTHTDFAKLNGVHHLKVFNAHKNGVLEGFIDENDKVFIYSDQEFGE